MEQQTLSFENLSQRDKRALVFQLLYSADVYDYEVSLPIIISGYYQAFNYIVPQDSDVAHIVDWIMQNYSELDQVYEPLLSNWRFDRISTAAKIILRYATWELLHTQLEPIVVINEAVELAKAFGEKDAYKFINGILDEVAKKLGKNLPESESSPSSESLPIDS